MYHVKHNIFRTNTFKVFIHGVTDTELRTGLNVITKAGDLTLKGPRAKCTTHIHNFYKPHQVLKSEKYTLGFETFFSTY